MHAVFQNRTIALTLHTPSPYNSTLDARGTSITNSPYNNHKTRKETTMPTVTADTSPDHTHPTAKHNVRHEPAPTGKAVPFNPALAQHSTTSQNASNHTRQPTRRTTRTMAALQMLRNLAARPPLTSIDSIRAVIENEHPRPFQTFPLRLCFLSAQVFAQGIHADFVDEDLAEVFEDFKNELENVARAQRVRLIFRLTIWSPRDGPPLELNDLPLQEGQVVQLSQVANLAAWKNLCQGTSDRAHVQPVQNN